MERSARTIRAILTGAALLLVPHPVPATTFGPVPLAGQLDHAQYVLEGRVVSRRVELERSSGRPHTYWGLAISKQLKGNTLPQEITLRQPGGEVGEVGYQVAGAAQFASGEEVIVMARDTNEAPSVKDVVGLSSGKYVVENGGKTVRSALGGALALPDGTPMSLREFEAFVERARSGRLTDGDRRIILRPERHFHTAEDTIHPGAKDSAPFPVQGGTHEEEPNPANSLQKTLSLPEESHEGHEGAQRWPWIAGITLVLAGLGLLIFGFTRK